MRSFSTFGPHIALHRLPSLTQLTFITLNVIGSHEYESLKTNSPPIHFYLFIMGLGMLMYEAGYIAI